VVTVLTVVTVWTVLIVLTEVTVLTMCVEARCCRLRTGLLTTAFFLATFEVSLFVIFWFHLKYFRAAFDYSVPGREDLQAGGTIVAANSCAIILLICGVNKDYSGRHQDLKRWWLCLPWIILYGLNIIGLFASGIVAFYQLTNNLKLVGLLPLAYGCFLLVFYILVVFFVLEQKHKLSGIAVRPLPSISSLVSRLE